MLTYRIINLNTNEHLNDTFFVDQNGSPRSIFYNILDFPTRIDRGTPFKDILGNPIFENDKVCWVDKNGDVVVDKVVFDDTLGFVFESNCFPVTAKSQLQILKK